MIQSVYVVNDRGETLAAVPIGEFQMDEVLFGGFLSAIQMYSNRLSGADLKEISLDNYRIIITKTDRVSLVSIHDLHDMDALDMNSKLCELVQGNLGEIITSDTIDLIRKTAQTTSNVDESASNWQSTEI